MLNYFVIKYVHLFYKIINFNKKSDFSIQCYFFKLEVKLFFAIGFEFIIMFFIFKKMITLLDHV